MRRGVQRFVQVDDTQQDVQLDVSLERQTSQWNGCVVSGSYEQLVVVLQQEWPLQRVVGRRNGLWLDNVVSHVDEVMVKDFLKKSDDLRCREYFWCTDV